MFRIRAVDSQAKAILQTIEEVSNQLDSARLLRRHKSSVLTTSEKAMIDETFAHTEQAIQKVAGLAERAKTDITSTGKVGFNTRLLCTFRDSPAMHVGLTQLGVATQSLNIALAMLASRDYRREGVEVCEEALDKRSNVRTSLTRPESRSPRMHPLQNHPRPRSAQSVATRNSYTTSFAQSPSWPSEKDVESTYSSSYSSFIEKAPFVFELELEEQMDLDLFQQATCFTPAPSSPPVPSPRATSLRRVDPDVNGTTEYVPVPLEQIQAPPPVTFTPPIDEAKFQAYSRFNSSPRERPRSWSGRASSQVDELFLGTQPSHLSVVNPNTSLLPAQQPLGGVGKDELWF